MPQTFRSRTISVSIGRDWREVYAYASDPLNLEHWASGLGRGFARDGEDWLLADPDGNPIRMRFTPQNAYGVLDHDVTVGGETTHNAMRVMPNGDGAELTFLLLHAPGVSEADFERDAAAITRDLATLKSLLER